MKTKLIIFSIIAVSLFAFGVLKSKADEATMYYDSSIPDTGNGATATMNFDSQSNYDSMYNSGLESSASNSGIQGGDSYDYTPSSDYNGNYDEIQGTSGSASDYNGNYDEIQGTSGSAATATTDPYGDITDEQAAAMEKEQADIASEAAACDACLFGGATRQACVNDGQCSGTSTTANEAKTEALAKTATQNAAAKDVDAKTVAMQSACSSSTITQACTDAQQALNDAKAAYDRATADAQAAIAAANALASNSGTSTASNNGAGFYMCANGVLGTTCNGGGGTLITTGIGSGGYTGSTFSTGGIASSVAGLSGQGCGNGFSAIGGVCFPTTTGLSAAPISTILANVFTWMMGLFTTFAVIAFVISGIQYLTSTGDTEQIEKAKHNAMYSLLGVVIGLSGFIIVQAIAMALSGQSYLF